jgi:Tol biopolymer transport system component
MKRLQLSASLVFALLFLILLPFQAHAFRIERVNLASDESQANGRTEDCDISADGKFVAFESGATNMVTGDNEGHWDIFVRDRINGTTERVSVRNADPSAGANADSRKPSISGDGRYVAFYSYASDITGYVGGYANIYVRDRLSATTELASETATGTPGYGGNGGSYNPSISADGRYVAFDSTATDLGPGGGTNSDIFVRDLVADSTTLVTAGTTPNGGGGNQPSEDPSISDDGRFVAFVSQATDLFNRDYNVSGTYYDIWVWDRQDSSMTLVSYGGSMGGYYGGYGGSSSSPSISSDGRYVAFQSYATNLVPNDIRGNRDIFVRDMDTGTTTRVSVSIDPGYAGYGGNNSSNFPVISPDGRYVVFASRASDLVPDDTNGTYDMFVRDLKRGVTTLVSKNRAGEQGNGPSEAYGGGLSTDGRYVAFTSQADNLVEGDTNSDIDVFVAGGFFPSGLPPMLLLLGD